MAENKSFLDKTGLQRLVTNLKNLFLSKTNTTAYTPTANYHPATKKYVDDNKYSLPTASSSVLGGVKVGTNLSISSGVLSAKDTTYSAATQTANGLMTSTDKAKLDGIASGANAYSLPTATSSVLGGVKIGSNINVSSGTISLTKANVTSALGYTPPTTNTTYNNASTTAAGLMSASDKSKLDGIASGANAYSLPTASASTLGGIKVGTNLSISNGVLSATNTTYSLATSSADGLMRAYDKGKLDAIANEATKNSPSTTTPKVAGTAAVGTESGYARGDHVHPAQTTVSGNAGSATKLQTARKINGVSFNGTADITIADSTKLPLTGGNMTGYTMGFFPATANTMVGNEYNILLNGGDRYTFTESGTGTLGSTAVKGLFNGAVAPVYSADGIDPSNPYVLLIENLPNVHTQTGGVFGWTSRYWYPKTYKIEFYDAYNSAGWKTIKDVTNVPTKELVIPFNPNGIQGSFTKIRITIKAADGSTGANGFPRWGLSEIFFCHPEAITAYQYAHVAKADTATSATSATNATNSTNSTNANNLKASDLRNKLKPVNCNGQTATFAFTSTGGLDNGSNNDKWADALILNSWGNTSGGRTNVIVATKSDSQALYHYTGTYGSESWSGKKTIAYTDSSITGNAATATKVNNNLIVKLNGGSTEGTNLFTFNGSAAKTINITASSIGAAASSHGTHVTWSTTTPKANGTAAVGTETKVARGDHVHPLQTTISGNAGTATKLATARTISLTGDVTGSASFDGSANASITATIADDSHNHIISNIDNLQTTLNGKLSTSGGTITGALTVNGALTANATTKTPFSTTGNLNFVNKKLDWNANSYIQNVILLIPVLTSTNWSGYNYIDGKFLCWKTGGNVYDVVEINMNCVYNNLRYHLEFYGDHPTWELCICKYNNVNYYALKCPYHANPYTNVEFTGHVRSELTGGTSTVALPLGVAYYNENTQTVLNSEVKNSLTTTLTNSYVTNVSCAPLYSKGGFTGTFNGTATKANQLTTARKIAVGNSEKTFDGTANVTWTLDEIGAADKTTVNNRFDSVEGDIETLFANINSQGEVTSVKTTQGWTFNNSGMNIGSTSTFNTAITTSAATFKNGSTTVATIDGSGLMATTINNQGAYQYGYANGTYLFKDELITVDGEYAVATFYNGT